MGLFGDLHPPLLIVGCPRSGTTILAEAIATHPGAVNRNEERVLWDKHFHRPHSALKTDSDAVRTDYWRIPGNFKYWQWLSGGKVVVNKHPENSFRIHFLKEVLPEAKLIHLVRDGRATVASHFRSSKNHANRRESFGNYVFPPDWEDHTDRPLLEQFSYMWNQIVMYASEEGAQYRDDFREVQYEELPERAPEIIQNIWEGLGLELKPGLNEKLPTFENRNFKWKEELSEQEVSTIENVAEQGLKRFGYL